ncbi:Alpha-1,3/1,6-mannosyltransferase ALG2 [Schistosoma japonicum]|uniref:Alpha-1,3/1,6-mannosyltransferase ALG2 n=1 Tax=Schistosoma japonicum TaxID=6182 RepID=A0A4Z2DQY0_SCHJA|nr:Alpha-1,3/1,6-mannosyltransferase ALG2 [Schistosoma japonicum]
MPKHIIFLHPDLGIGGAERLIVDSAVALQSCGYNISIITNHHDPNHCFEETLESNLNVTVVADWFPRSLFGYMTALCAYIRLMLATLYLLLFYGKKPDVTFVDQISAPIILLRAFGYKTIFYCHFPDLLLTRDKNFFLKKLYRLPIDYVEQLSTGMANVVLVNSKFTSNIFRETFTSLNHVQLRILYPIATTRSLCLPTSEKSESDQSKYEYRKLLPSGIIPVKAKIVFVSINRYERKKNLTLALNSLDYLITHWDQLIDSSLEIQPENVHLVIAGGYDRRVVENVEYYVELVNLSKTLKLSGNVTFLRSCSSEIKPLLIASSDAVIYTPDKEHFGIVPIESMLLSRAVIALDSGGPKETVLHNITGFLCTVEPTTQLPENMANYLSKFINDSELAGRMGKAGCKRVAEKFSSTTFKKQLQGIVADLINKEY